ncbi:hypothetical protein ABT264_35045 [Streptomyces virginiae]|uniref:hypothetical protein n=1 Tax=Streptomyces virginiae TaxID=1961 RepID=UPI00331B5843
MSDHSPDVPKRVAYDLADGIMRVQQEDGLYRHLAFASPASWTRLTVITWPYNLLVAGSHGSFHFERHGDDTKDMLGWLRGIRVNPGGWASKLVNGSASVQQYDRDRLENAITERVAEAVRDGWAPEGLEKAVRREILDNEYLDDEQHALRILDEFQHGMTYRTECTCGKYEDFTSYDAAVCWEYRTHPQADGDHKVTLRETGGFTFDDISDWPRHKLDYHFVYQCHAASWAVRRYDRVRRYGLQSLAAPKAVA